MLSLRFCWLKPTAANTPYFPITTSRHNSNTKVILVKYVAWKKDSLQCRRYQGKLKTHYSHCHGARKFPHLTTKFNDMIWSGKIVCSMNCLVAWNNLSKLKWSMIFCLQGIFHLINLIELNQWSINWLPFEVTVRCNGKDPFTTSKSGSESENFIWYLSFILWYLKFFCLFFYLFRFCSLLVWISLWSGSFFGKRLLILSIWET